MSTNQLKTFSGLADPYIKGSYCFTGRTLYSCLRFKLDQAQDAKKMEKLNNIFFTLMACGPESITLYNFLLDSLTLLPNMLVVDVEKFVSPETFSHMNHSIFSKNLAPINVSLRGWRAIDQHFGSMEKLISKMSVEGAAIQGSGWVVVCPSEPLDGNPLRSQSSLAMAIVSHKTKPFIRLHLNFVNYWNESDDGAQARAMWLVISRIYKVSWFLLHGFKSAAAEIQEKELLQNNQFEELSDHLSKKLNMLSFSSLYHPFICPDS
ncbi:Mn/Fe-superoxide dismutase [Tanacetum coccineum]